MNMKNRVVYGGVDTHRDVHVAAAVDTAGRVLGTAPFPTDTVGYQQLTEWFRSLGKVLRVGVEGTGSYGAGLTRYLTRIGIEVVEVNRPNRQLRRQRGKTDTVDAEAAAPAAANGMATALPKTADGPVEAIRMLRVVRRSAVKARTQAANQLHALVITAPEQVKHQLKGKPIRTRVRICAVFRPADDHTTLTSPAYTKKTLRHLARRYQSRALIAAGDNPHRLNSEASFAALCGASPVQASSGQTIRHRLNHSYL